MRLLPERIEAKVVLRRATALVAGSEVALAYGAIVVTVAVVLAFAPDALQELVVQRSSTNLVNLNRHPIYVLVVSAFVVANIRGLYLVPFLMVAYAAAQRWLGRIGAITAGVFGHVGTTLFVATLLAAGIRNRLVDASVARESDVGVSYGLAAVAGMLVANVSPRWRWWYLGSVLIYFAAPLIFIHTFTALGHATALGIGLALAWIARQAAGAGAVTTERQNAAS